MIGIFDSGVGGLSLVREFFKILPQYQIVYFGDSGRFPYGNKSLSSIRLYSQQIADFLDSKGAQALVVACNTASAVADDLRLKRQEPIFDVIHAACTEALKSSSSGHVGIMGTASTIRSGAHATALRITNPDSKVYEYPCPSLATLIEDQIVSQEALELVVRSYLGNLDNTVDTLILGCTHYPLISDTIQRVVGSAITLIDPAKAVAGEIQEYIENHSEFEKGLVHGTAHEFFVSDEEEAFSQLTEKFLGKKFIPKLHRL